MQAAIKRENGTRTQRHRAYEVLREVLTLRRIAAGERIREPEWCQRIGVNRSALREALGRLHSEGLVTEGERCGYAVPAYTPEELDEISEIRCMVEEMAIERIIRAGRNRREYLKRPKELCDELEWILARSYSIEIAQADHLFHGSLVSLSENRRLILLYQCLPQSIAGDPRAGAERQTGQLCKMLREHREILDAVHKGQAGLARKLLQRHYGNRQAPASKARIVNCAGSGTLVCSR